MTAPFAAGSEVRGRVDQGKTWFTWVALMCLAVGLISLDRGFAKWRNDARNFAQANGAYLTAADLTPEQQARMSDPAVERRLALAGTGLLIVSVVLFGIFPFAKSEQTR